MAFYRVTVWRRNGKVYQGIRELDNANVDYATNYFRYLAQTTFNDVEDVEAALLSNKSTAVLAYIEVAKRRRERNRWPKSSIPEPVKRRKDYYSGDKPSLGERNGLDGMGTSE